MDFHLGCKLHRTRRTNAILTPSLFKKWVASPISVGKCVTCSITKCKTLSGIGSRMPLVGWQSHQNPRSNLIKPASSWPYLEYQIIKGLPGGVQYPYKGTTPQILGNSRCPSKVLGSPTPASKSRLSHLQNRYSD